MSFHHDRRSFLLGAPALLGISNFGSTTLEAQTADAAADAEVIDFWVRAMGVPPELVAGAAHRTGRGKSGDAVDFGREPLFLHYDPDENSLIPATELPTNRIAGIADAQVDFRMVRLRLNAEDERVFNRYSSGGIYLDFQQQQQQQKASGSASDALLTLASSVFSAIFSGNKSDHGSKKSGGSGGGSGSGANQGGGGKTSGGGAACNRSTTGKPGGSSGGGKRGRRSTPADTSSDSSDTPAATIGLQRANQAQSIALPGGAGKTAFACFAKDRKKSAFGQFVSAISQATSSGAASYLQLLGMPLIAAQALDAVRALVANLQSHGGDQQWIMQSPPMDVVTTADASSRLPGALRLRTGYYVVLPKAQSAELRNQVSKLKVLDGFLVPKEATPLDVFDAVPVTVPGVSYLTLNIGVGQNRMGSCAGSSGRSS